MRKMYDQDGAVVGKYSWTNPFRYATGGPLLVVQLIKTSNTIFIKSETMQINWKKCVNMGSR